MWTNWTGRPSRNLPRPNYKDESSDEYDSPIASPNRPVNTRQGSPAELLIPQLNDNVDEELEQVSQTLKNIGHTPLFRPSVLKEEVIEGQVVGAPAGAQLKADNAAAMPDAVRFDTQNENDEPDVYKKLSSLTNKFSKTDPKFWFNNFERSIKHFGVKSQITKKEALINLLTPDVTEEVKSLLSLDEDDEGETPYLTLKQELLSLYSPRPEDCYAKASSRVLTGKPSALAKQIINDFCECPKPIQNKCCAKIAFGMWSKNLPTYVKTHISDQEFNHNTYKKVLEMADKCWNSHRPEPVVVAAIKAENVEALKDSKDFENPAVAAMQRGRGRGGRGARGGRGQRGGRDQRGTAATEGPARTVHAGPRRYFGRRQRPLPVPL